MEDLVNIKIPFAVNGTLQGPPSPEDQAAASVDVSAASPLPLFFKDEDTDSMDDSTPPEPIAAPDDDTTQLVSPTPKPIDSAAPTSPSRSSSGRSMPSLITIAECESVASSPKDVPSVDAPSHPANPTPYQQPTIKKPEPSQFDDNKEHLGSRNDNTRGRGRRRGRGPRGFSAPPRIRQHVKTVAPVPPPLHVAVPAPAGSEHALNPAAYDSPSQHSFRRSPTPPQSSFSACRQAARLVAITGILLAEAILEYKQQQFPANEAVEGYIGSLVNSLQA
ncbi:hypothetical protein OF83DRAFT_1178232 [Amylostereum chailletii]|nr:hypothetical protein OF83DRAFT_1178232 [Amylostereum chailletii]